MRSIDERLAQSNPVREGILPTNYEQMLSRVIRQPRGTDTAWRTFRFRMAGSVAAASALTVLGVSVLNGAGTVLPVLGFQASAQGTASPAATKIGPGATDMMPIMLNYSFTGEDSFSTAPRSAPVYAVSAPSDLRATLNHVATVLGVSLASTPSGVNSDTSGSYGVNGEGYSGSIYTSSGSAYWNIYATPASPSGPSGVSGAAGATSGVGARVPTANPTNVGATGPTGAAGSTTGATGASGATGPMTATGALATRALGYVRTLGNYTAGVPTQTLSAGTTTIDVPLLINGSPSDMTDTFAFANDGTLQSASGSAFALALTAIYPLISASEGVSQINVQNQKLRRDIASGPGGPITFNSVATTTTTRESGATGATGATGPTGTSGASGVTGPVTTTTPAAPTTLVRLTGVINGYAAYDMVGGWMELPVYTYAGTVVEGGYRVSFSVIPLALQYLNFAVDVNPVPAGAR